MGLYNWNCCKWNIDLWGLTKPHLIKQNTPKMRYIFYDLWRIQKYTEELISLGHEPLEQSFTY